MQLTEFGILQGLTVGTGIILFLALMYVAAVSLGEGDSRGRRA